MNQDLLSVTSAASVVVVIVVIVTPLVFFLVSKLPYLLLNSTGTDPKTRMHPVFFGESIEVNNKPEQEIK